METFIDMLLRIVGETIEKSWDAEPNLANHEKVDFFERLVRYSSQQRNHFLRLIADAQAVQNERDKHEKDDPDSGDTDD